MPVLHSPSHLFVAKKEKVNCPRIMLVAVIYIIILVLFSKIWFIVVFATVVVVFCYGCSVYICVGSAEIETDIEYDIEEDDITQAIRENNIDNRRIEATIIEIPTVLNFENVITPTADQIIIAIPVVSPVSENIREGSIITTIEL